MATTRAANGASAGGEFETVAGVEFQGLGGFLLDGDHRLRGPPGPPGALDHSYVGGFLGFPGNRAGGGEAAAYAVGLLVLGYGDAVNADQAHGDGGSERGRGKHAGLGGDQGFERGGLRFGDADQEDVGHFRRRGRDDFLDQRILHQVDGEGEHHTQAERDQNGLRLVALPVQIRHALPEKRGDPQGDRRRNSRKPRSRAAATTASSEQADGEPSREVAADSRRIGEPGRDAADTDQNEPGSGESAPRPSTDAPIPGEIRVGHIAAQDERRDGSRGWRAEAGW